MLLDRKQTETKGLSSSGKQMAAAESQTASVAGLVDLV